GCDPAYRGAEEVEGTLLHRGGDFRSDAVAGPVVLQYDCAGGALHRLAEGPAVQGPQAAQVDDLDGHAVLRELLGHLQRGTYPSRVADHRQVAALAGDGGRADLRGVLALGDLALGVVEAEVLQHHHGIVVADRGGQQTLRVGRVRGGDHLHPGDVGVPDLEVLRVRGRKLLTTASRGAD